VTVQAGNRVEHLLLAHVSGQAALTFAPEDERHEKVSDRQAAIAEEGRAGGFSSLGAGVCICSHQSLVLNKYVQLLRTSVLPSPPPPFI
jgi:hypothetical protein